MLKSYPHFYAYDTHQNFNLSLLCDGKLNIMQSKLQEYID